MVFLLEQQLSAAASLSLSFLLISSYLFSNIFLAVTLKPWWRGQFSNAKKCEKKIENKHFKKVDQPILFTVICVETARMYQMFYWIRLI
jgi:hypothetical protein